MRRTYRKKKWKPDKTQFRANTQIRVPEVRLIDEKGEMLGVMPTAQAMQLAQEREMDLVEVNPTAQPPIAKLADFGKVQYEREKLKQKQKAKLKKIDTKGIRLSLRISEHDREVRINQAQKFLDKGHRVKIELPLRGRENAYKYNGIEIIQKFIDAIEANRKDDQVIVEELPKKLGYAITALISVKSKQ